MNYRKLNVTENIQKEGIVSTYGREGAFDDWDGDVLSDFME